MAFQDTAPVPYYRPVEPTVPVAPKYPQGDMLGGNLIAAMAQRAIAAERAKIDQEQMLQQADIAAKRLDFDRDRLGQDADLTNRRLDIEQQGVDDRYELEGKRLDSLETLQGAEADWYKQRTEQSTKEFSTAFQRNLAFEEQRAKYLEEAGKDAEGLGLYDYTFQQEHPMQFAKNVMGFERLYGGTNDPKLQATVKDFVDKASQLKVSLDGPEGRKTYPWSQVVQDMERNGAESPFIPALKKGGYFQTTETTTDVNGKQVPTTVREPGPVLKKVLSDSMGGTSLKIIDQIKRKTDPFAPKNATEAIAMGVLKPEDTGKLAGDAMMTTPAPGSPATTAATPGTNLPPPEKSKAEMEADHVNQLIQANPDNADQYRALYLQRNPGREDLLK